MNIPVSFTEERRGRELEEDRLLQQFQHMKDSEAILQEQVRASVLFGLPILPGLKCLCHEASRIPHFTKGVEMFLMIMLIARN